MLGKLSTEEIVKGFVEDYLAIRDDFKKVLYDNGFRWQKDSYKGNEFGNEGTWINHGCRLSIKARWGKVNTNAIIYIEKEFFDKVKKFFDLYMPYQGMDSENSDYDLLNKGEIFKKDESQVEGKKKVKKVKDKKEEVKDKKEEVKDKKEEVKDKKEEVKDKKEEVKDKKEKDKNSLKRGRKNKEKREIVYVDVNDVMERAKETIMQNHGGVSYSEIEYVGFGETGLKFTIPKLDRKGKCNETMYFESEKIGKDGGCGGTGGSCMCGEIEGHDSDHICEFCGGDW